MTVSLPKLVAHRGYALCYPENTLLALQAAIDAGARYLEFDVLLSKDRVPVLFHDRDLRRMCGQSGAVHEYSFAQLRQFQVFEFERFGYRFAGNPITSLAETVNLLVEHTSVVAFVEIKRQSLEIFGIDTVLEILLPILEPVRQQAVIISYSLEALQATRERSGFAIGAVFDDWREHKQVQIQSLQAQYLFTDIDRLPRFGKLKPGDSKLAVYECVDPVRAVQVHRRGVDLVETFDIGEMQTQLSLRTEWPG